jgi:peptidoglycan/xylan/chitin deacetylase (PgdA/CDA1 family)
MSARLLVNMLAQPSRLSVLIFHRVRPRIDPLFPGEPDAARFEQQLRWVKDWFTVLPLADAVAGLRSGKLPARPLAITFDDGYADNATMAMPILRKVGLHATFFVATGFLNGGRMWNDTVIEAVRAAQAARLDLTPIGLGVVDLNGIEARRAAVGRLLTDLKHLPIDERLRKADAIAAATGIGPSSDLMMTDTQVKALDAAGMAIGAHTVSHPILAMLPDDAARSEIDRSRRTLEQIVGKRVKLFAYPNGKPDQDYAARHVAMVRELGFDAAVSTAPGAAAPSCDLYQIPRFTPWDREAWRYGLRLARNTRQADYATAWRLRTRTR